MVTSEHSLNKNKNTFINPLQRKQFVGYFSELRKTLRVKHIHNNAGNESFSVAVLS